MDWKAELIKRLDALADKLGTTGAYLWHVLVRQGTATGIADCIVAVVFAAVFVVGVKLLLYAIHEGPKHLCRYNEWEGQYVAYLVVGIIMATVGLAFSCVFAYEGILEIANPGYFALQEIFKVVR